MAETEAVTPEESEVRKPVTGGGRTGEAKEEGRTGPKEGEGPRRRVAQGRREAGPRRHGRGGGVRAEGGHMSMGIENGTLLMRRLDGASAARRTA